MTDKKKQLAEMRRNIHEVRKVTINGITYTIINSTPIETTVTAADRLHALVKAD